MQAADMSQNTSIDALFAHGIPPTLAPAIQWAHTDFFTTIALTTHGYDTTVMPRCRPHLNFFRANASLTLIPISQGLHFTLLVVDHTQRQLRGYDSLYGLREYDNSMITNLRTLRRLISDEAMALGITDYTDDWTVIPDAARREGLPRQINGIDCGRYVILTALCLTHTPQIPLAAITPLTVANSREFLASSIASQHLPQTASFYAPFAPTQPETPLPPPELPAAITDMPAPITRRRRRADDLGDAEILPPQETATTRSHARNRALPKRHPSTSSSWRKIPTRSEGSGQLQILRCSIHSPRRRLRFICQATPKR